MQDDLITLGRVSSAHGIRGEIKVHFFHDIPSSVTEGSEICLKEPEGEIHKYLLKRIRRHQNSWLVMLDGPRDRDGALALKGYDIVISRKRLPEPGEDEYYVQDLIGLDVYDDGQERVGVVKESYYTGAHEVLVIETPSGNIDVPFVEDFIIAVDLDSGRMILADFHRKLAGIQKEN